MRWSSVLILFVVGATFGSGLEATHVYANTTFFLRPCFLGLAWWVFPLFGGAGVAIGVSHAYAERFLFLPSPPAKLEAAVFGLLLFTIAYLVTSFSPLGSIGTMLGVLILYLLGYGLLDRSRQGILLAVLTALIGSAVESYLGSTGHFGHREHDIVNIPFWLPTLYLNASLGVGMLGRYFRQKNI